MRIDNYELEGSCGRGLCQEITLATLGNQPECVCVCVKGGGGDWLSTIEQLIVGPGERAILLGLPELQLQLQPPLRACQIASVCGHILQQFVWH